jgi:DNA modification methylase
MTEKLGEYKIVKVADVVPYARNARAHDDEQVNLIAASIREFGFTNPILIDDQSNLIAGHGRLMAATKLKMDSVPSIVIGGLTDTKRRALILADNKIALNSTWDEDMLRNELESLKDDGYDLALTGFNTDELDSLLADVTNGSGGLTDEDDAPAPPEVAKTVLGDVWVLGNHRLMCGDSTSIDAVEKLMAGQKADMVFTDPPYGVDYKGINNDSRNGLKALLDGAFGNILATSKSGASCYVFHSDRCADIFHECFRKYFHFSSMVIWVKNSLTLSKTDYQSKHESCLYGWMNNGTHKWHGDRKQTSIWECSKETVKGHTTPKPVEIIERALNNSSKGGDIIQDLFGGSGSTMIACEKNGRSSRLMELDPKYCDVIINRWQDFTGLKAVHAETGKEF